MKLEIGKNVHPPPPPSLHRFCETTNDMYLKLSTNVKTLEKLRYDAQSQLRIFLTNYRI